MPEKPDQASRRGTAAYMFKMLKYFLVILTNSTLATAYQNFLDRKNIAALKALKQMKVF